MHTASGQTPGIVQTLCRPFQAFSWLLIHKPSPNSTVPVAWITEPAMDSWYEDWVLLSIYARSQMIFPDIYTSQIGRQMVINVSLFMTIVFAVLQRWTNKTAVTKQEREFSSRIWLL